MGRIVLTAAHVVRGAVTVLVRRLDKVLHPATADPAFVGDENGPGPDLALVELGAEAGVVLPEDLRPPGSPSVAMALPSSNIEVDHVTIYRWVQRFTPLLIDAAQPCRHTPRDRWFIDETYVKVSGQWVYLYRAIDQFGQVIDVLVSEKRDLAATRRFFIRTLEYGSRPTEVTTDQAPVYPRVIEELIPAARHVTEQYANNRIEADHGLSEGSAAADARSETAARGTGDQRGHAFVQNLRHGHYELGVDIDPRHRLTAIFTELTLAI